MKTKTNFLPWLLLLIVVAFLIFDRPATVPGSPPRESIFQRAVVAVKVWLFDHRHLFQDESLPAERRYTTDEWHATYANRPPQRKPGPDGFPVIDHGEGF